MDGCREFRPKEMHQAFEAIQLHRKLKNERIHVGMMLKCYSKNIHITKTIFHTYSHQAYSFTIEILYKSKNI